MHTDLIKHKQSIRLHIDHNYFLFYNLKKKPFTGAPKSMKETAQIEESSKKDHLIMDSNCDTLFCIVSEHGAFKRSRAFIGNN